jgi:hypothetical protein
MSKKWPLNTIVEVEWRDSCSASSWDSPRGYLERRQVGPMRSVGYLLKDGDGMLSIMQSMSFGNGDVHSMITIPREAVTKIKRIKGLKG